MKIVITRKIRKCMVSGLWLRKKRNVIPIIKGNKQIIPPSHKSQSGQNQSMSQHKGKGGANSSKSMPAHNIGVPKGQAKKWIKVRK